MSLPSRGIFNGLVMYVNKSFLSLNLKGRVQLVNALYEAPKLKMRISYHLLWTMTFVQVLEIVYGWPRQEVVGLGNEVTNGRSVDLGGGSVPTAALEDYLENCGKTILLGDRKSFKFTSPNFGSGTEYPMGVHCQWNFVGDKKCTAEFTCKEFDLNASDEECSGDALEVADGVGGVETFCGKRIFEQPIRASNGLRDLYVTFKSKPAGNGHQGFLCEVKCAANKNTTAKELQITFEKTEDNRCVCGLQNTDDRIVGGEDAKINEFPWQVAIVLTGTRSPKCGGSIINNNWVLTAAHCFMFDKSQPSDIEVLFRAKSLDMTLQKDWKDVALGKSGSIRSSGYKDLRLSDEDEKTQRFKVVQIINHPRFSSTYDYDVALLKLDTRIDLSHPNAPTPICLPPFNYENTFVGEVPMVVGWGLPDEKAGGTTRNLQKLPVPILPFSKCQKWSTHQMTPRMLCAGYERGEKDACTGDSGGPLALKKTNKQWEQVGIVSWGEGCARKQKPGIYSRITELNQWIHRNALGATWCKMTNS